MDDDEMIYGSFGFEGNWDSAPDVWEHQGVPLTVGQLRDALARVPGEVPIKLSLYAGGGTRELLEPVEVDFTGAGDAPDAMVITAAQLAVG